MDKLGPEQKAAIVLLALGETLAAEILKNLDRDEGLRVLAAMNRLGRISSETSDPVLLDFGRQLTSSAPQTALNGPEGFSKILNLAFRDPSDRDKVLADVAPSLYQMKITERVEGPLLFQLIANESLQTKALILSHCAPKKAAQVLKHCPEQQQSQLIQRVANLNPVNQDVLAELDEQLLANYRKMGASLSRPGGVDKASAILNYLGASHSDLLDQLSDRDPQLADAIAEKMFTFQDLAKASQTDLKILWEKSKKDLWIAALRGEQKVLAALCTSMSDRSARMLKEDIEALGPQRKSTVVSAQKSILAIAKELEELGMVNFKADGQWVA